MGRSIIADENVRTKIDNCFGNSKCQIGLLIGQLTNQKDYVIHIARTPAEDNEEHSLEKLDEKWLAQHAQQVLRMLPGGLDVVGIFVIGTPEQLKVAQVSLRQALFTIRKRLNKVFPFSRSTITDRILLQICSLSKKITCRTFDVADPKSTARPADWKYQNIRERWIGLSARLSVDVKIAVSMSNQSLSLEKQLQNGLSPTYESISNSLVLLNGQIMAPDAALDSPVAPMQGGKKNKNKKSDVSAAVSYDVKLLACMESSENAKLQHDDCAAELVVRGTICSHAFVHNKATATDAEQAIKDDMVRSMMFRFQLLCEDLLQNEEEQDPVIVYESPIRAFTQLTGSPVMMCDYIFQDEGASESASRFQELLDLTVADRDIDMTCERIPDEADLKLPAKVLTLKPVKAATNSNYIGATIASMIAVLAAGISYLYLGQE